MVSLEEHLLSDYGNIPQKVGSFLLNNNLSTFKIIKKSTGLNESQVRDSLSLLIQRRIVSFYPFERTFKYFIDKGMLLRRLYFPIYLNFVLCNFASESAEYFKKILLNGILKENNSQQFNDLFNADIIKYNTPNSDSIKHFRNSTEFLIVNYDVLDQKILEEETFKMIKCTLNEAAACVYKSIVTCSIINEENILNNLQSTKILISDKGVLINERNNIYEYLRYLVNSKFIIKGQDRMRLYFPNSCRMYIKRFKINNILKDASTRRIFNMVFAKKSVEDKEITMHSLLSVGKAKMALICLQKFGLISQKCNGDYSAGSRIEHSWIIDFEYSSTSMKYLLETKIKEKIENINRCWNFNYNFDNQMENQSVWISDMLSLSVDHLIFNMR